jgi:hypothetical protein
MTDMELKAIASALAVSIGWLVEAEETFAGVKGSSGRKSRRIDYS